MDLLVVRLALEPVWTLQTSDSTDAFRSTPVVLDVIALLKSSSKNLRRHTSLTTRALSNLKYMYNIL